MKKELSNNIIFKHTEEEDHSNVKLHMTDHRTEPKKGSCMF